MSQVQVDTVAEEGWQIAQYRNKVKKKSKKPKQNQEHKSYSSALKSINKSTVKRKAEINLTPLKSCLDHYVNLSKQNPLAKSGILDVIDIYRTKLGSSLKSNTLKGLEIRFSKDVSDQAIIRDLESKMIATPAESHHILKESLTAPRLSRSRSTSWSTPSRPPGFEFTPKRLFSPPFVKKSPGLLTLEAKQEKAQELREQQLHEKIKKRAEKEETIAQRLMKIEEERKLKKEQLDEKMQKAVQNRAQYIRSIQQKAKTDLEKLDEIQSQSINILQTKKEEVQNKQMEKEQRLSEIDEGRQRKLSEASALQEAAAQRRKQMEEERLEKLEQMRLKEKQAEEELQRQLELKKEKDRKKNEKLERIRAKKLEIEEEKKKAQALIIAKLELGAQRKDEKLRKVREKAAAQNQNAKIVATRIRQNKDACPSPSFGSIPLLDEQPVNKTRLKKLKSKILGLSRSCAFLSISIGELSPKQEALKQAVKSVNKNVFKLYSMDSFDDFDAKIELLNSSLDSELDCIEKLLVESRFPERIVDSIQTQVSQSNFSLSMYTRALEFLVLFFKKSKSDYLVFNESSFLIKTLDSLAILIPCCVPGKENDSLAQLCVSLLSLVNVAASIGNKSDTSKELVSNLLSYSTFNLVVSGIEKTYSTIYGTPESLGEFVNFLLESVLFLDNVITFGNESVARSSVYDSKKLSNDQSRILSLFLESNFMGMTTMLTTCLLSIGGSFKSAGQAPLSDSWLQLIDSSFGILEKLCHFDLKEIQNMISPPTELYHLLLFSMQQHTVQQSPVLTSIIENVARLVGHLSFENVQVIEMCQIGLPGTSLLQRLIRMPFEYFNTKCKDILLPTLMILAADERNRMVIEEEVSLDFLSIYLKKNSNAVHPKLRNTVGSFLI